ncbi:MAG: MFS transporter [Chloroflexi bacterium]|nr:MFS transporter [Chloroflexota bacterium]
MSTTPPSNGPTRRQSPFVAFQHHDFRLLWFGQIVSQAGTQMTIVAISWQLYKLTNNPLSLGLIGLFRIIPLLLFSLGSGVLADSFDRRKLMLLSQTTSMTMAAVLAVATYFGLASPALIYAVILLSSTANTFDLPARQALIPSLVPREHLTNALSLNIIGWQIATIVGPTIGGLLLAWRGNADVIYAIDAISFGAVILSLLLMRTRHIVSTEQRKVSIGAALEGLRFVRGTPILFWTMALDFIATFFAGAMTLLPVFAQDILRVDEVGLGILYAAPSVGAVVTGMLMAWIGNVRNQGPIILWSVAAYGLCTAIFGVSTSFILSCVMLAGIGAADTISMVIRNTLRQTLTPDELRGRMVSVNQLFFAGGPQLGEVEAGVVARLLGASVAVWTGGVACILGVLLIGLGVPSLRRYQDPQA